MKRKQGQWHLLTGTLLGIALGVLFSLLILPVRYIDTEPSTLRTKDREIYRQVVARAYLVEADTSRALARIALLKDINPSSALIQQAQNTLANNGDDQTARGLALLGAAVNQPSLRITPLAINNGTAAAPTLATLEPTQAVTPKTPTVTIAPTRTLIATFTPRPTATPSPTLGAPFVLVKQESVCDPLPKTPMIEIEVQDANGKPIPGVRIQLSQVNGGSEPFFTGLYPEINEGYANYVMTAGMEYALRVGEAGQLVSGLKIPTCKTGSSGSAPGSIFLLFQQP
jgi:hypothetical protein